MTTIACLDSALGSFRSRQVSRLLRDGFVPDLHDARRRPLVQLCRCFRAAGRSDCQIWLGNHFHEPAVTRFGAAGNPTAAGLIWYQSAGQAPATAKLPLDKYWRNVEAATFRSRWDDPQAVCIGIQARSHAMNHEHLDIGSFVLDALVKRRLDRGSDNYNLPGYFGKQRFDYYPLRRKGTTRSSSTRRRGRIKTREAKCRISRFASKPDSAFAPPI